MKHRDARSEDTISIEDKLSEIWFIYTQKTASLKCAKTLSCYSVDSLARLEMVMDLEREFGILLDDGFDDRMYLMTFKQLTDALRKKIERNR